MEFTKFIQLLHPIIGAGHSTHSFTRSMFESVVTDEGASVLDEYTESSFKAYFNGNTKINKIAKALSPYVDPVEFVNYLEPFADPVTKALLDAFLPYIPNATERTINEDIADLFVSIIKEAAAKKRKSPSKKGTLDDDSSHKILKNKIISSGQVVADALKAAIDDIANEDCVADAEVIDEESNATKTENKTTIIQHQTNVIQNGDNNINLTNNGVMNFNFGGGNK